MARIRKMFAGIVTPMPGIVIVSKTAPKVIPVLLRASGFDAVAAPVVSPSVRRERAPERVFSRSFVPRPHSVPPRAILSTTSPSSRGMPLRNSMPISRIVVGRISMKTAST